ncbi:DUF1360 domain-containing protein [Quadrisphaera sp. DSM 44207]|uniref:DUF1360 domain-containing protein n=1 Tax=Quadrisphaera sp. DSM 44207 TaxID=1881057 RepID=UPI0008917BCF|nr:DUF1360 domain-containing protein [Quadrisphaera sp. DSM 44207]SDQ18725.1 Protein of unknown function [Quadrisphaera sp. DSM 44207]
MRDTDARLHRTADRLDPQEPAAGGADGADGADGSSAGRAGRSALARAGRWYSRVRDEYQHGGGQDDERPLTGYALLSTGYLAATGVAVGAVARRRRGAAPLPGPADMALLAVAVARTTRTVSKDAVLSHLRAPFTVFVGSQGSGEVLEQPRPGAVRHAVGELVTCPFCLGQWVGTAALVSYATAPRATRWAATLMTLVAASDALQFGYAALEKTTE